jgi:branched-chain amino acid aminotransferase
LKVWLNGGLVDAQSACISPADHGFLLGDGVFETLRSHRGRVPTLREHLERLAAGARAMAIEPPPAQALEQAVLELLEASGLPDARVRITVTSGSGPPGLSRGQAPPTILITAAPLRLWPETATAVVAPWAHDERSPLAGVKTTSRAESVMALLHARERGADEALFLNRAGNVCEATTANVFAVLDGTAHTPPLSAGCLAGITREQVLELCRQLDIAAAEQDLPPATLKEADELFLTSSTRGVQALVEVDGAAVGTGEPGPTTRRLTDAYSALLEESVRE